MAKFNIEKTLELIAVADLEDQITLFNKFKTALTTLLLQRANLHEEYQNRMLGLIEEINITNKPNNNGNEKNSIKEKTKEI